MKSAEEQLEIIKRDCVDLINEEELKAKLKKGTPLRIKLGVDPTAPDIHLGHAVPLQKLRDFQDLGHQIVLLIGNFTALIGDPSGKSSTRPPLSPEEVEANARTYTDQAFLILDRENTEIVYNADWFGKMTYHEILQLNARVTMQQMLQREDFKNRIANAEEVRLHEIQYPIMQGWDSVEIKADVEIGGTDQLFNILVGRDFQKSMDMEPQIVLTMPLLEGLDGNKKMSKSLGNYIGLNEAPSEMFGKAMSISDEMMPRYYDLAIREALDPAMHPLEAKKQLAQKLVAIYHDDEAGAKARSDWDSRSKGNLSDVDLPEVVLGERRDIVGVLVHSLQEAYGAKETTSNLRRMCQQGGVQLNGKKVEDPKAEPDWKSGDILKIGKKRAVKIQV